VSRSSNARKTQLSDTRPRQERAADKDPIRAFRLIVPEAEPAELPSP
jgi:hypothetical protein